MANITAIGYDMDHTLVPYNRKKFETLAFKETLKKFIEAGYPEELLKLEFKNNFLIRGLLVDREKGNILKVDGHKYVKVAYHGHTMLTKEERDKLYNKESFKAETMLSVDTFFSLSEVQLFCEIVDFMAKNKGRIQKSYEEVYKDLRHFIDLSHRDGSIKEQVLKHPEEYILKDKHLSRSLIRLIESGKTLFLMTNSYWDYTNQVMQYVLDSANPDYPSWRDYFEHIIVGSGKPGFFSGSQPFFEVVPDSGLLKINRGDFDKNAIYHGGNARLFQSLTGHKGDEILYVGDHIYGDIIHSKGLFNWRTMLIIEELEEELRKDEEIVPNLETIIEKVEAREEKEEELQKVRSKIVVNLKQKEKALKSNNNKKVVHNKKEYEKTVQLETKLSIELNKMDDELSDIITKREEAMHPIWGQLMKVGLERSRFAEQVNGYSCIYSAKASNLRYYSPYKRFVSFRETMPHEQ